jgi:hypothetical protein
MLTAAISTDVVMKSVMHKVTKQYNRAAEHKDIAQLLRVLSDFSSYQYAGDTVERMKRRKRRSPQERPTTYSRRQGDSHKDASVPKEGHGVENKHRCEGYE